MNDDEARKLAEDDDILLGLAGTNVEEAMTIDTDKIEEARKALRCLYIAVDKSIADDVRQRVEAAFVSLSAELTGLRQAKERVEEEPEFRAPTEAEKKAREFHAGVMENYGCPEAWTDEETFGIAHASIEIIRALLAERRKI